MSARWKPAASGLFALAVILYILAGISGIAAISVLWRQYSTPYKVRLAQLEKDGVDVLDWRDILAAEESRAVWAALSCGCAGSLTLVIGLTLAGFSKGLAWDDDLNPPLQP